VRATGLFLAERYLPASMAHDLVAVVDHERAAARVAAIRHVRTTYAASDETCFSLFEAPSLEMIEQANDRFQLGYRRVAAVIEIQSTVGALPTEGGAVSQAREEQRNEEGRTREKRRQRGREGR
jgi:hypothetical protein